MKTILAAIDFSDVSDTVLAKATELAQQSSAHLWILHVAAPDPDFVGYEAGPQHVRDWRANTLQKERRFLQDKADELEDKIGIQITPLMAQGPTADTILKEAADLKVDLIVLGSHGHGALYELIVGTVTEALLRASKFPVLVIPANQTES
ncbi:universal stress protein [Opitutaceae bacterium]|jgi:nucleotide-binding universal stress UspA family protein|nr:universal stress protein [Opitutaceae bacterium]